MTDLDKKLILRTCVLAEESRKEGNHPFAALLADEDGNILLEMKNEFKTGGSAYHAETLLALKAARLYSPEKLKTCTLYSNFEPCCMCTGAIYWANIGRIVYGASEKDLLSYTKDNDENPTFNLSSREVISRGQKDVVVEGPVEDEEILKRVLSSHDGFWS